jgi:GT2 family glycosyltransferase
MPTRTKVSIIILNLDRADLTSQCVKSVRENTEAGSYEIIVVDNGSGVDDVKQVMMLQSSDTTLLPLNRNMFFGEANNIGAEKANGEYVLFLNNDVEVTSGWLVRMLQVFDSNLPVGAVGPKLLFPDGSLQEAGAYILPDGMTVRVGKELELPEFYLGGIQVVDYCSAACLLIKRDDFLNLGGFDPIFEPAYCEDVDLAVRLRSIGLFTYYCGQAEVFHELSATSRRIWTNEILQNHSANNQRKFVTRWGSYLRRRINEPCEPEPRPLVNWEAEHEVNGKRRIVLYSSNPLDTSETSRRLLLVACAFEDTHDVIIAADEVISRLRVYSLCREFGIELGSFRTRKISDLTQATNDIMITFDDIDGHTCELFESQIRFETNGEELLDLLEQSLSSSADKSIAVPFWVI